MPRTATNLACAVLLLAALTPTTLADDPLACLQAEGSHALFADLPTGQAEAALPGAPPLLQPDAACSILDYAGVDPDLPSEAQDPLEPAYRGAPEIPYNPAVGCLASNVTLTSLAPVARVSSSHSVSGHGPLSGYSLQLSNGTALPGPVELRLSLGAGRHLVDEHLDLPGTNPSTRTVVSHNNVSNVHSWVIDTLDGGLHPVHYTANTECQVSSAGVAEAIDIAYFQWDSRMRCAGADAASNAETRGASGSPSLEDGLPLLRPDGLAEQAEASLAGDDLFADPPPTQPDRVNKFVVGLNIEPTLPAGSSYYGALVTGVDHDLNFYAVEVRPDLLASFASLVSADATVRYCDADVGLELHHAAVNDPLRPTAQPNLDRINVDGASANHAWHTTFGTTGKNVCIVDTGLRSTHEEFTGGRVVGQKDFTSPSPTAPDGHGHGTHVAGIAAANTNNGLGIAGVAQSGILVAKVFDDAGAGSWSWLASAIHWCADNGGDVISMSLGDTGQGTVAPPTAVADAVTYAWSVGSVLVASTGNDGCPNCVTYPAKYPEVIGVACTDNADAQCTFSNSGPEVDLAAPGLAVRSSCRATDSDYCNKSGTSMSAPHVAGAAALFWSHVPGLSNVQVRDFLFCGARDVGAAGWDSITGNGVVDVGTSLEKAIAGTCSPTPCTGTIHSSGATHTPAGDKWQADVWVTHSPATAHVVAWSFATSDGTPVTHVDTGHDAKRVFSTDNGYRHVTVTVDLSCGVSVTGWFPLYN